MTALLLVRILAFRFTVSVVMWGCVEPRIMEERSFKEDVRRSVEHRRHENRRLGEYYEQGEAREQWDGTNQS